MQIEAEIQQSTLDLLALEKPVLSSFEAFRQYIIKQINELINKDFQHLLFILYRIDVSEEKVKNLLQANNGENAAAIIADLIIERQRQKILSRQQFKSQQDVVDDGECEAW
jgi:hypothetical protein